MALDDLFNALLQQESGNRNIQGPLITSGANAGDRAQGPAQVMPKTGVSPGYGVAPINPNASDPDAENRRFGNDYLNAMKREFGGDVEAALIGYNAGPANAKKWLAAGRDYSALPKRSETEPYVRNILAMSGGKSMPTSTSYESGEPYFDEYMKRPDANKPLANLMSEMIGQGKARAAQAETPVADPTLGDKIRAALVKGGAAMAQAGAQRGASFLGALGQGAAGGALGVEDLKKITEDKKAKAASAAKSQGDALDRLRLSAAKLLGTPAAKAGKKGGIKFTDIMKMLKDQEPSGMGLDPAKLSKTVVDYGEQVRQDPLGDAFLKNTMQDLMSRKDSLSPEEQDTLTKLTKLYSDVELLPLP